jgi:hypothetical protein
MSRKRRTRLRRRDLGRLGAAMIGEKAEPNVPPSPYCLLFLEAARGLGTRRRATAGARTSMARGVRDAGVRVVVAPVCGVSRRHEGRRGNWRFSWRPVSSGASASRAATTFARSSSRARVCGSMTDTLASTQRQKRSAAACGRGPVLRPGARRPRSAAGYWLSLGHPDRIVDDELVAGGWRRWERRGCARAGLRLSRARSASPMGTGDPRLKAFPGR